jgi:acetamidase/formamidase
MKNLKTVFFIFTLCFVSAHVGAQTKTLEATPQTVHWGYYDNSLKPALTIKSGETVSIETISGHAGDAPDMMMDDDIRTIYKEVTDRGPGPDILTGPIAVEGAKPGDTLEVHIDKLTLRPGVFYGSNMADSEYGILRTQFPKNRATVYKIDETAKTAAAAFAFDAPADFNILTKNVISPGSVKRVPALKGIPVPVNLQIGNIGVAPSAAGRISSYPSSPSGGNLDDWRLGEGATIYLPVSVNGALFSAGDGHSAQGDGEINGTGIETSLNAVMTFKIRKDMKLTLPVIETSDAFVIMAFADKDLNEATRLAANAALDWLVKRLKMTPNDAYSFLSVAVDFKITQVVNSPTYTVSAVIPKASFLNVKR